MAREDKPDFLRGYVAVSTRNLRKWHRRVALIVGSFFIVQGLTGSIAQQRYLLMQASDPETYRVAVMGAAAPPGDIAAIVHAAKPDFRIAHMMYPDAGSPGTAIIVMGGRDATTHDMSRIVTVDPYSRRVTGEFDARRSGWVGLADAIHKGLLFGVTGKILLTLLGLGVIAFTVMGLILWWRTRETSRNARGLLRVHRTVGLIASVFILSVATSGVALNLSTWAEKGSGRSVFASNMSHVHGVATPVADSKIDGNRAYALAQHTVGAGWRLAAFGPAGPSAPDYWFAFFDARLKRVDVLVDPQSGTVRGPYSTGLTSGGEGIRAWLFPIHSGYVVGRTGGLIYSLIGVLVSLWVLTGFMLWRRNRRPRARIAERQPAAA